MYAQTDQSTAQLTDFIEQLAEIVPQRRRYHPAAYYLIAWLLGSLTYIIALTTLLLDIRFDMYMRLSDITFLATVGSMFVGATCFAYSSILSSFPGRKDSFSWYGVGMLAIWGSVIVYGMVCEIPGLVSGRVFFHFAPEVFALIVLGGIVPMIALWCIVRYLVSTRPSKVALTMSLASFMLSATVLRFYYVSLYNGADCNFNLFFWMLVPLVISSVFGWASFAPFVRTWLPRGIRKSTRA